MAYYLGLDNGGTSTKAAIYDSFGTELAVASTMTIKKEPQPGFTERDMDEMCAANAKVIREVIEAAGIDSEDIACVACCGHGKGLYLVDADGRPVRPGIISTDNRAWEYPLKWEKSGIAQEVFGISCQHILASQPVSLLAWLKDNEPDTIERTKWIFMCKDYIRYYLTGEARAERTDYSGSNLLNLSTGAYDESLLKLFGLSECMDKLPPLCDSAELCGKVSPEAARDTGLREGTPVAGGAFDIDACALAVNVTTENNICMIAGTWSINEYIRKTPVTDGTVLMNSYFCLPGYYLVEECSPTSAGNNEWFVKTMLPELAKIQVGCGENIYQQMSDWVASLSDDEPCPIFFPFLFGSNVHPNAKGAIVGLRSYHTRAHIARSIYEGIVFSHRYHLDKLLSTRKNSPESIRMAGGAANSTVWVQMFADVCGLPIEVAQAKETGTLGCAILAATAAGEYESLADAAAGMCKFSSTIMPRKEKAAVYQKKYSNYLRVINALDQVWDILE